MGLTNQLNSGEIHKDYLKHLGTNYTNVEIFKHTIPPEIPKPKNKAKKITKCKITAPSNVVSFTLKASLLVELFDESFNNIQYIYFFKVGSQLGCT